MRRRRVLQTLAGGAVSAAVLSLPRAAHAAAGNRVTAENALPGAAPGLWWIDGVGDPSILGYAWPFSVNEGGTVQLRIDGSAAEIRVYRLGWYAGAGARLHATIPNTATQQPDPVTIPGSNGAVECTNWATTAAWQIPYGTCSGVFVAVVHGTAGGRSHIPFVVRNDDRAAALCVKTSDATWQAYNYYGGRGVRWNRGACLYGTGDQWSTDTDRAYAVSWARPIVHRATRPATALFNGEYPLIRFLEECGIDVQYIGSQDLDRSAAYLQYGRKAFLSSGHDEYWSQSSRDHAEQAAAGGVHRIFMSGNEAYWRTRFTDDGRVMWCHKDTMNGPEGTPHVGGQPLDPVTWTGTYRDTRRPGGGDGEVNLTGTRFRMNGIRDFDAIIDPARFKPSPFWRGTPVAAGTQIPLRGVIGFEADELGENVSALADSTIQLDACRADDNGQNYDGSGPMRWGIAARRNAAGAVTVGFGTCQWAWALSDVHDRPGAPTSRPARQATLNLLTDMGAPPARIPAGLQRPTRRAWSAYRLR